MSDNFKTDALGRRIGIAVGTRHQAKGQPMPPLHDAAMAAKRFHDAALAALDRPDDVAATIKLAPLVAELSSLTAAFTADWLKNVTEAALAEADK